MLLSFSFPGAYHLPFFVSSFQCSVKWFLLADSRQLCVARKLFNQGKTFHVISLNGELLLNIFKVHRQCKIETRSTVIKKCNTRGLSFNTEELFSLP